MATLYPVSRLIKDIVEEKETRMRETMAAMGLNLSVNAAAAWVTSAIMFTFLALMISLIAKSSFFPRSEFAIIFLYFELLLMSEIGIAFLVASVFSRARLASILGPVALFAACLPRYIFFGTNRYEATLGKKFASLSSVSAFCFGAGENHTHMVVLSRQWPPGLQPQQLSRPSRVVRHSQRTTHKRERPETHVAITEGPKRNNAFSYARLLAPSRRLRRL
jgi:hypothetical protein